MQVPEHVIDDSLPVLDPGPGDRERLRAPAQFPRETPMQPLQNPLQALVRNLELRAPLSESDRQAVLGLPFNMRMLEAGSYTVREAEPPMQCGVLLSGFAYRQKLTGEGDRQIV